MDEISKSGREAITVKGNSKTIHPNPICLEGFVRIPEGADGDDWIWIGWMRVEG
jgi:hypothetical protein